MERVNFIITACVLICHPTHPLWIPNYILSLLAGLRRVAKEGVRMRRVGASLCLLVLEILLPNKSIHYVMTVLL